VTKPRDATVKRWENGPARPDETWYELTLVVNGASDLSTRAIANTRHLCDTHIDGCYHLSVVDLHDQLAGPFAGQVLAAPTLVKDRPLPTRRFVGDLSHTDEVLVALGIPIATDVPTETG
jgi:circadian clock protein KaiB